MFAQAKWFFQLPIEEKASIPWDTPESNRGYSLPGAEKLSNLDIVEGDNRSNVEKKIEQLRQTSPDQKESFDIGLETDPNYKNKWPVSKNPNGDFRQTLLDFYETGHKLHLEVMRAIALGLGVDQNYFDRFCDHKDHTLRLLHYPRCKVENLDVSKGNRRAGEHTDYGTITLLFQEEGSQGGLQVRKWTKENNEHQFVHAPPLPNAIVVNVGDLLQRWTNDMLISTEHRVVSPPLKDPNQTEYDARYTVVFFANPNFHSTIECIPQCQSPENPPRYPPVNSFEWLVSRLKASYS
jgi:isopenicillin N synthase-like dioxygenase